MRIALLLFIVTVMLGSTAASVGLFLFQLGFFQD